ncbi:MAG: tyrosine-type recombinase/integrase [Pseudomonadota bacterium]
MNWSNTVSQYLQARRNLGYSLTIDGNVLHQFAAYADTQRATLPLSIDMVQQWAALAPSGSEIAIARRLSIVRSFSKYLHFTHSKSPIIPAKLIGRTHRRLPPFIYSHSTVNACLNAASALLPAYGIRSLTIRTLLGLLISSGLRPGEAVRLQKDDVDVEQGTLTIMRSKNWHRRVVPIVPSTVNSLKHYLLVRELFAPLTDSSSLFLMDNGEGLNIETADHAFTVIRQHVDINRKINGRYPRLYDFRHTFVCRRIQVWYENGLDVNSLIPSLSRYLGHKKITDTYWYVSATPQLMKLSASRFERYCEQGDEK